MEQTPSDRDHRRLFFGAEVIANWPQHLPKARILPEGMRHITLAFLGNCPFAPLNNLLSFFPTSSFSIGPAGIADQCLFLPDVKPRVAATSVQWQKDTDALGSYQKKIAEWLTSHGHSLDKRPFLPHITLARSPLDREEWRQSFLPFPFYLKGLHLYESLGNLTYQSIWNVPWLEPFEELDHTADIAFLIRGETVQQIHYNAQIALSFHCPELIKYFTSDLEDSLDGIIMSLNTLIARMDSEEGSPFKAVSFHGTLIVSPNNFLTWEMIVDV
jgi:2'-5' RNA ligase